MESLAALTSLSQEENNASGIHRNASNAHAGTRLNLVWDDGYGLGGPVSAPVCCFCARDIYNLTDAILTQLNRDDSEAVVVHLNCYYAWRRTIPNMPNASHRTFWLRADRVFQPDPVACAREVGRRQST